jgi:CopG-like RHH_1 or ribbon-helix-helix domain, RHH_5
MNSSRQETLARGRLAFLGEFAQEQAASGAPPMWCMKRTNIYLADGHAEALDRVAEAEGVSRAELIRGLIDRAIGGPPGADVAADLAAIEGSFGVLADQEPFSRDPDERMNYLDGLADA